MTVGTRFDGVRRIDGNIHCWRMQSIKWLCGSGRDMLTAPTAAELRLRGLHVTTGPHSWLPRRHGLHFELKMLRCGWLPRSTGPVWRDEPRGGLSDQGHLQGAMASTQHHVCGVLQRCRHRL